MTKKDYDSVQYVGQRIRDSLENLIKRKAGGEINVKFSYNDKSKISHIDYSISGLHTRIDIFKQGKNFYLKQEIVSNGDSRTGFSEDKLNLKKSRAGRISDDYADSIADSSLEKLKKYHQSK